MPLMRAAAAQCDIGTNLDENLATCLRVIDLAAQERPDILVLPEFCNHLSWYRDRDHSYLVAVDLEGEFLRQIGERARQHGIYVMINCTIRRPKWGEGMVSGTNILFDCDGRQIAASDKQVLMGSENNFLTPAREVCPILALPFARVGMYSCMDGVIYETPRGLALRGAQVLLNSLNSFALDEASLHVPVRAAENQVFVVAANKIGWLVPPELAPMIAERVKVDPAHLQGAGESQIIAPDGRVLAKASHHGEAVICAEFDPAEADDKRRTDGTLTFAARRPALYTPLWEKPTPRTWRESANQVTVAVYQPKTRGQRALDETVFALSQDSSEPALIVLPELFFLPDLLENVDKALERTETALERLTQAIRRRATLIALSVPAREGEMLIHQGVILDKNGILHRQPQIHQGGRHEWAQPSGSGIGYRDTSWGRIALVVGADTFFPESFRLAALAQAEIVACPTRLVEGWESTTGLPERAAENRLNVIAASFPSAAGGSAIHAVGHDFTLWTEWATRPFDGHISRPITTRLEGEGGWLRGAVYPSAAHNRMVSQKTDVVDGRPWWLG